jgi:hypothetical protein
MSTEVEVFLDSELDLCVIEPELEFAAIGFNAFAEGFKTEGGYVALHVVNEVDLVYVQVTVLCLELGVVEADIGTADDQMDEVALVLWVDIVGFSDLNEVRLEVRVCGEEGSAEG